MRIKFIEDEYEELQKKEGYRKKREEMQQAREERDRKKQESDLKMVYDEELQRRMKDKEE